MSASTGSASSEARRSRFYRLWPPALLVLAGFAAYANSFSGGFVFDDASCITDNPTIRHLTALGTVLSPPSGGVTVSGRPVVNLTLALNYALGGTRVWGYHAVNLAIHLMAGLTLFGIVRRTPRAGTVPAFFVALIWLVHPLQTESVTYVIQRAESLMGLFYLLTLYCVIRYAEAQERNGSPRKMRLVFVLSTLFCLLGMATKEVMVSAPVIAFLYDRTFIGGSCREAWRRRAPLYLALASTWLLLAYLVIGGGGGRDGTSGFGTGVSWWAYVLTQFQAIVTYLQLTAWPHPLVFEYGTFWIRHAWRALPYACVVVPLAAVTLLALRRWPVWGFLGFWFFSVLAPTTLVPGTIQMIVEHRMYLALAPVVAAIVFCGNATVRRRGAWAGALTVFAAICILLTVRRNEDYRAPVILWADTAIKRPYNALAHYNLGAAMERMPGRMDDAVAQYREAIQLNPGYAAPYVGLGNALAKIPGKMDDAIAQYQEAIRLKLDYADAHHDLGKALSSVPGRLNDAIAQYREALRLRPDDAGAHNDLGNAYVALTGRLDDAISQYREALRISPDFAEAHYNLGRAWSTMPGRSNDAIAEYRQATRLTPDYAEAHYNLGNLWLAMPGRAGDAAAEFQDAIRINPDYAEAHNNLGNALVNMPGRWSDAIAQYQEAIRIEPGYVEAHNNLGNTWAATDGKLDDAVAEYREALRLKPDYAEAHNNLASALGRQPGRLQDAIAEYREALRLKPDYAEAHYNLAVTLLELPKDQSAEARAQLEACLRLRPDYAQAREALAKLSAR